MSELLGSTRLMRSAVRILRQARAANQPPAPRDEFDPNIEAIKRLKESGVLDE